MAYSTHDDELLNHRRAAEAQALAASYEQFKADSLASQEAHARSRREQEAERLAAQAEVDSSIEAIIEAKLRRARDPQNEIDQLRLARAARPAPEDRRNVAADAAVNERSAEAQRMEAEFARRTGMPSILDRMAASVDAYRVEQAQREERTRFLRSGGRGSSHV